MATGGQGVRRETESEGRKAKLQAGAKRSDGSAFLNQILGPTREAVGLRMTFWSASIGFVPVAHFVNLRPQFSQA